MKSLLFGATGLERQFSHHEMMLTIQILVRRGGGGRVDPANLLRFKCPGVEVEVSN